MLTTCLSCYVESFMAQKIERKKKKTKYKKANYLIGSL